VKTTHKLLLLVPAILLFAGVGALTYYMKFLRYKGALEADLAKYTTAIEGFKAALDEQSTTEQKLRDVALSTLGFSPEEVDSNFREGLNRLAVDANLVTNQIVVTTQTAKPVKNPAVEAKVAEFRGLTKSDFIAMSDLYVLDAEIRGVGTFAAVTRLLALAQSQPWIWSVRGFSLKPRDAQASSFDIRLDVSTAFMPDLAPPSASPTDPARPQPRPPAIVDPTAEQVLASGTVVSRNVFAPPAPPQTEPVTIGAASAQPPAVENAASTTPPPPPPPYHEWRLTSVSNSPAQGSIAIMLNERTGSAVFLSPGQALLDAVLVLAAPEQAVFQIGDQKYALALDQTLADRHPLE
jgi:hypothetical protein